jgi:hypothetical protein
MEQYGMKSDTQQHNLLACPLCGGQMALAGRALYYDRTGRFKTPVYACGACDIFYREVEEAVRLDHYYAATYVQESNEKRLFESRAGAFHFVLGLADRHLMPQRTTRTEPPILVDYGSAYGHLLKIAGDYNYRTIGVEVNEDLIASCSKQGLEVVKTLSEVPGKIDVITFIDSLYCFPNCREVLLECREHLNPGGLVIARVTNRNLYARLRNRFTRESDLTVLGDAIISFSLKSLTRLFQATGFEIIQVKPDYGQGKCLGRKKSFAYKLSYLATILAIGRLVLTPGIYVVARVA